MKIAKILTSVFACLAAGLGITAFAGQPLTPLEELGKALFFDANLSTPPGQSCAACHAPEVGFTGPDSAINSGQAVYPGAVHTRAGNRKPPSAAYAGDSPILGYIRFPDLTGMWLGGMFWDGRATGWTLGDPLAEQAMGPFLNPLEQNMPQSRLVVSRVAKSAYAPLFEQVWGPGSLDFKKDVAGTYERIARSIAAYERSAEVSAFTSKYDYYLKGEASLTDVERSGLELFNGRANCAACHLSEPGPGGTPPLFTDFTYDNLGIPRNLLNPFYSATPNFNRAGAAWIDPGLGGFLKSINMQEDFVTAAWGKHKVPTLRNVAKAPSGDFVKAYGHNGYFKSLKEIVHFYNTRDDGTWPVPEVNVNVNATELGNLGLTEAEEDAIVAFMKTLTDGYAP